MSLGVNWRSTFDRYLRILSTSFVTAERADGQQVNFTLSGSTWTPDSDIDITLSLSGSTWTLTDHDDKVETYTTTSGGNEALLNSIQARNGYTQTLTYNGSDQLTSVSDSYGRTLSLTYHSSGTLHTVTTPDSTTLTYSYTGVTGGNQLTSVKYSTSPSTSQTYNYADASFPFALTSITDENGNTYNAWTYDGSGRALTSQLGSGANLTTLVYGTGTTTVTNALGVTDTYSFTTLQNVPKATGISRAATSTTAAATESFSYDSNGYLASKTDWNGNQTTYTNNSHGLPTTINEAVGSSVARTTTIAYDTTFVHLPDSITTPGLTTGFTYDSDGNVLTRTLTDTTTTSTPYSTNGQTRTTTNTWSSYLLASVKTPNGNTTSYGYDSSGALTSITDALSHVTSITSHTGGGLPLTIVDPNSVTTTLTYNPRQWLLTSSVSTGGGARTTTYTYDAAGNLTKTTLPDSSYLANTYDTAHRVTQVTDALGNYAAYTLDALGDHTQENTYTAGAALTKQHSATFDALGRILTDVGGVGQTTTYTYDANGDALTITDGLSHTTTRVFDALNRLHTSTDAASGVAQYAYDPHDKPLTVTDPNGNATTYVRDGFEDAIQQASPDSGTTVYHYDSDANLTSKTDAASVVTNQTFDALDRVLTTTYPADSTLNVAYTYDQTGTGFSFGVGRLTSLTDASGSLTRAYDERGNLLTEKRTNGTTVLTTSYTYDVTSRMASMTYPSGTLMTNTRDAAGKITTVAVKAPGASSATNLVSSMTYAPYGPMTHMSAFNGVSTSYTLDADYRITAIDDISHTGYVYDNADNLTSTSDWTYANGNQTLSYDSLNRLTYAYAVWGYGTATYSYDANGNMTTQNGTTYSYSSGTNRLSGASWTDPMWGPSSWAMSYTATGNVSNLEIGGAYSNFTGTYNAANRLASVSNVPLGWTNSYDAFGQRITKTQSGSGTPILYSYDQRSSLLEEQESGLYTDYIYVNGRVIGLQENNGSGSVLYYVSTDTLGTPHAATDSTGSLIWSYYHFPYGYEDGFGSSITQNLRFPGMYADDDPDGFMNNLQRDYYSPTGRYLEADPIGLAGGLNPYRYANDNPLKFTDRLGLLSQSFGGVCSTDNPTGGPWLFNSNGTPVIDPNTGIPYPVPPGGIDVQTNASMGAALQMGLDTSDIGMIGFFRPGGSMDYQRVGGNFNLQYRDITNYNYGVVEAANGDTLGGALWIAGQFNQWFGHPLPSDTSWGIQQDAVNNIQQGWHDYQSCSCGTFWSNH